MFPIFCYTVFFLLAITIFKHFILYSIRLQMKRTWNTQKTFGYLNSDAVTYKTFFLYLLSIFSGTRQYVWAFLRLCLFFCHGVPISRSPVSSCRYVWILVTLSSFILIQLPVHREYFDLVYWLVNLSRWINCHLVMS